MKADPDSFDVCGPLPKGLTLLEASAGTGKTFTISALVARYVAEGTPLDQLLVVTFTRAATSELRERVRKHLVAAATGLRDVLAGGPPGDDLVATLADAPIKEVQLRCRRLHIAMSDFDAATIVTTHGFCQQVLEALGTAGDVGRKTLFVEDTDEALIEVVDDLYLRWALRHGPPPFDRAGAIKIARAAWIDRDSRIEPASSDPGSAGDLRRRFAEGTRREITYRKLRSGTLGYDDQLTRLRDTLVSPQGPAASKRLASRYRIVLVDEFQDTDPTQWEILHNAFTSAQALVLIGDPKQAIYSFRGADIFAYLKASEHAGTKATLGVNWRSDAGLLSALDGLLHGATLGHPEIRYRSVRAADEHAGSGLFDAPHPEPLRIRVLHRRDLGPRSTKKVRHDMGRSAVLADLAAEVVELLSSGATRLRGDSAVRLAPGDLAVLVSTNSEAAAVRDRLEQVGVPAVINGGGSVFTSPAATDWLQLLQALERPSSTTRARAAAMTPFIGWNAARLAVVADEEIEQLQAGLHEWGQVMNLKGVAAFVELVTSSTDMPGRLLSVERGERLLTDLRHIGQLLHAQTARDQVGVAALASWLRRRMADDDQDGGKEERSRRLESDVDAVQVLTVFRSKGLEFPVVYLPFMWIGTTETDPVPVFHVDGRRTIDVSASSDPGYQSNKLIHDREQRGEDLRKTYVALTRAHHQVVLWWAAGTNSVVSPLGRLLFGLSDDGDIVDKLDKLPTDEAALVRLNALAQKRPGLIGIERAESISGEKWASPPTPTSMLRVRHFERALDTAWQRTSYTRITASAHGGVVFGAGVTSEPDEIGTADETGKVDDTGVGADTGMHTGADVITAAISDYSGADLAEQERYLRSVRSLMADIPGGTGVGNLVHAVLEFVEFDSADLSGSLRLALAEHCKRFDSEGVDHAALSNALSAVLNTPLGPIADNKRLSDFARHDRLDELAFELPIGGGDDAIANLHVSDIADCLDARLSPVDPMIGYGARLRHEIPATELRGYLIGSIDLLLRVGPAGSQRYVVVDYKTNRLAGSGEILTAWHYRNTALVSSMQRAHYPLQALLYSVALHRYLRWRVPDYDPHLHLGGVLYLFVRGMTGTDGPLVDGLPCGVFSWRPPAELICELSEILDGAKSEPSSLERHPHGSVVPPS